MKIFYKVQGERRFFRVCFKWLAKNDTEVASRNLIYVSEYGRYDDMIYSAIDTPLELEMLAIIKKQLALDIESKTPSLLGKWLPSENASAHETKRAGNIIRSYLGMTHRQYRKTLSILRERINVLERLMSANRWNEIEFDKIPSKAGLIYKNAFARRDIIAKKYEAFAKDENTKVNAETLYPYDIVSKVVNHFKCNYNYNSHKGEFLDDLTETDKAMLEKYWTNQKDYLNGEPCKMMCVVDTSGSMWGREADAPINVAISLGMYCAERVGGPFKDHYISFSSRPQFIKVEGVDFVDKVKRIYKTNLCENTNLAAVFELLKEATLNAKPEDRLDTIVVISDMQIDYMSNWCSDDEVKTEMERIREDWEKDGLVLPNLVYWNVNAFGSANILDMGPNVSYVSGCSPIIFQSVLTGKTGYDLMLDALIGTDRYGVIY
jgi:hypothetical protein